ncbi:MAG: DUF349 domain-containing protein [Bacteroidota bacterium]
MTPIPPVNNPDENPDTLAPQEESVISANAEMNNDVQPEEKAAVRKRKPKAKVEPVIEEVILPHPDHVIEDEEEYLRFEEQAKEFSREQLIVAMEENLLEEDLHKQKSRIGIIRVSFNERQKELSEKHLSSHLEMGGSKEDFNPPADELDEKFKSLFSQYKQKKAKIEEAQEVERKKNLEQKLFLLEELRKLVDTEESLKKTYDEFRGIQEKWREIGPVPPKEVQNIWQNYHHLVERFFDKVKINNELKELDQKKNLEKKMQLCEKAEELLVETSVVKSIQQLQKLHEEWRLSGPVPNDKRDEIWLRFKTASDIINKNRLEYYDSMKEEQEKNLMSKTALCEKIEQLNELSLDNIKEWEDKTNEVSELQKAWKTIGFAPKKNNDEIWKRFKAANDLFFHNRNEFYRYLKDEKIHNINLKLDLCVQAEAIQESTEWKRTTEEYLRLQQEWRKTGPVPKKHAEKLWKRFRAACDHFFNRKNAFFTTIDSNQEENLKKKTELIETVENYVLSEDNDDNLKHLREFQRLWTEIGHVPVQQKDKLWDRFRAAIDKHFENLKISGSDRSAFKFKSRLENIVQGGGKGVSIMIQEKNQLLAKINGLKSDIAVWENNIGFFSNSKSSEMMRKEFESKIEEAKERLKTYEAKLKIINELRRNSDRN